MSIPDENIILEGSLKRCKKYKLFKTKWIEHYFVLYCSDRARNLFAIDEFKSSRKNERKKTFKLEHVIRVESNLSVSEQSILCTPGGSNRQDNNNLHCIFGIGFRFQNLIKELYLVAKSDDEMKLWVNEICKICKLHRQNDDIVVQEGDISQGAESSISGMSISSQSLDMSIIEQQQFVENQPECLPEGSSYYSKYEESEDRMGFFNFGGVMGIMKPQTSRNHHPIVRKTNTLDVGATLNEAETKREYKSLPNTPTEEMKNDFVTNNLYMARQLQKPEEIPDQKQYHRMHHYKSANLQHSHPSNPNYNNLSEALETRSETSSMYSNLRTEEDSASYTSGPPIPPPRARHALNRFVKNGQVGRLHMIPASTSMGHVAKVEEAEDSSGETLKLDTLSRSEQYPDSVTSSESFPVFEHNGKTLIRRAPPPVDRSNKPKNMRNEENGTTRYRNVSRSNGNENTNYSATYSGRQLNHQQSEASKRRNLDYFRPIDMIENLSTPATTSTRSPTPSDIEYISVDVDRTLAFKQIRRAAHSTD